MAHTRIYACDMNSSISANDELPSPVSLSVTREQIWSEDTGRAQSGSNQAEMIGKSIAGKRTYQIKWGVLSSSDLTTIKDKLTRGFFKFGVSTGETLPVGDAFYRSEISYDVLQAENVYYKDVSVSVIEK